MFSSRDVDVLTQPGVSDGFEDLETSQDLDGVGGQGETIAATHIMRKRRGEEGEGSELGISQGLHGFSVIHHHGSEMHTAYRGRTKKYRNIYICCSNNNSNRKSIPSTSTTYNQSHTGKTH